MKLSTIKRALAAFILIFTGAALFISCDALTAPKPKGGTLRITLPGGGGSRSSFDDYMATLHFILSGEGPALLEDKPLNPGPNNLTLAEGDWELTLTILDENNTRVDSQTKSATIKNGILAEVDFSFKLVDPNNSGFYTLTFQGAPQSDGNSETYHTQEIQWTGVNTTPSLSDWGLELPDHPGRPDETFAGWYTEEGVKFTEDTDITADMNLSAWFEQMIFVVSFYNNADSETHFFTAEVNNTDPEEEYTVPEDDFPQEPYQTYHTFIGWFTDSGEPFTASTPISGDVNVYAHWKELEYWPGDDILSLFHLQGFMRPDETWTNVYMHTDGGYGLQADMGYSMSSELLAELDALVRRNGWEINAANGNYTIGEDSLILPSDGNSTIEAMIPPDQPLISYPWPDLSNYQIPLNAPIDIPISSLEYQHMTGTDDPSWLIIDFYSEDVEILRDTYNNFFQQLTNSGMSELQGFYLFNGEQFPLWSDMESQQSTKIFYFNNDVNRLVFLTMDEFNSSITLYIVENLQYGAMNEPPSPIPGGDSGGSASNPEDDASGGGGGPTASNEAGSVGRP